MKDHSIQWLSRIVGKKLLYVVVLLFLQALLGGSSVLYALLLRNVIDSAVSADQQGFWTAISLLIGLVAIQLILRALSRRLTEFSHAVTENLLKKRLLNQLLQRDYARISATHSGEWMNRLTNDTVVCAAGVTDIVPGIAGMVVKMLGAVIMVIAIEPRFAYILIPGGGLMLFFTYAFRKVLKRLHKKIQESDGVLRIFAQERLESMPVVRSFAAEEQTLAEAQQKMENHKAARMKRNRFSNFCNIGFGTAIQGMYLLGLLFGGIGLLHSTITYGTVMAILQLITQIQAPFANLTGYLPKFYAMTASAERLMEAEQYTLDYEQAISAEEIGKFYRSSLKGFGLDHVFFTYKSADREPTVLKDLSVHIRKGDYIAITGHSGCGKSTMLKLFMCLYQPDEGIRYFDGIQRESLSSRYRRLFAYVPQGNQLMSGTIREIVSFARPEDAQNDDAILEALNIACADDFIHELDNGLDTLLGEKGQGLSEGQMQRIAVARAVFSGNPILLLDEATSALDENTEAKLLVNLKRLTDKTVLIVTHRPKALEICNRVITMTEEGLQLREI